MKRQYHFLDPRRFLIREPAQLEVVNQKLEDYKEGQKIAGRLIQHLESLGNKEELRSLIKEEHSRFSCVQGLASSFERGYYNKISQILEPQMEEIDLHKVKVPGGYTFEGYDYSELNSHLFGQVPYEDVTNILK